MKAKDIFGLIVRVLALILVLYAIWNLSFAIAMTVRLLAGTSHDSYMGAYYTFGVPALIIGLLLLRFARHVVKFSYPTGKDDSEA